MAAEAAVPAVAAADPALVEQALRQGQVAQERQGVGFTDYFFDFGKRVAQWLLELVGQLSAAVGGMVSADFLIGALGVLFLLAFLALVFLLLRAAFRRRKAPEKPVELVPASHAPELPPDADWEAEVERRLSRGEVRHALEALWWWLAKQLGAGGAERSWTTRELVLRSGRRDLLRQVMPLDRLLYAGLEPTADEVRGLARRLRGELGGAEGR